MKRFFPNKDHSLGASFSSTVPVYYKISDANIVDYFLLFVMDEVEKHFMQSARVQVKFNKDPTADDAIPVWVRVFQHSGYVQYDNPNGEISAINVMVSPEKHNLYVKNTKNTSGYLIQAGLEIPESVDGSLPVNSVLIEASSDMLEHRLYDTEKMVDLLAKGVEHDIYVVSPTVCFLSIFVVFVICILLAFSLYTLNNADDPNSL